MKGLTTRFLCRDGLIHEGRCQGKEKEKRAALIPR